MRESHFNARRLRDASAWQPTRAARLCSALLIAMALLILAFGISAKLGYSNLQEPGLALLGGGVLLVVSVAWAQRLRRRRHHACRLQFSPDLLKKRH